MPSKIIYLGHMNYAQPVIEFVVNGRKYAYELPNAQALDNIIHMIRRVTIGKAFAHAKRIGRLV